MAFRLIPREEKFYDDFLALADELQVGARLLEEMLAPDSPAWDKADEIKEVEHKCDSLTHEVLQRLNRTFVTPLDREDIHALAQSHRWPLRELTRRMATLEDVFVEITQN